APHLAFAGAELVLHLGGHQTAEVVGQLPAEFFLLVGVGQLHDACLPRRGPSPRRPGKVTVTSSGVHPPSVPSRGWLPKAPPARPARNRSGSTTPTPSTL